MKEKCLETGKRILDKKSAITAVNDSMERTHKTMRTYQCSFCNFWHLATDNKRDWSNKKKSKETIRDKRKGKFI